MIEQRSLGGEGAGLSRRAVLKRMLASGPALALPISLSMHGCSGKPSGPRVVLYSSVDGDVLDPILADFTGATGIEVLTVGDTEATKTTGLVERVVAEKSRPRADVFWSSEVLGMIRLDEQGLLAPYASVSAERDMPGARWPAGLRGAGGTWYGLAQRCRVLVYATRPGAREAFIRGPRALGAEPLKRRVGIANPRFGTTRSHLAAMLARSGAERFEVFVRMLHDQGARVLDGNAAVVRAVAQGEIDVGLTDSDDARAGLKNRWPIASEPVGAELPADPGDPLPPGALLIPNTIAMVRSGPNPTHAAALIDFVLSARVERALAAGESANIPVRPEVTAEFPGLAAPGAEPADWAGIAARTEEALRIWDAVMGG